MNQTNQTENLLATGRVAGWLAATVTLCTTVCLTTQAGLLAHWNFDETGGITAHDSAGTFDGTLSPTGAAFVPGGISGNAISVSKVDNGFVTMGNVLGLTQGDFSVVAWVKMNVGDTTECSTVVVKQEAGFPNGYAFAVNACGAYSQPGKVWFSDSSFPGQEVVSTSSVNDGAWHQVVGVYHACGSQLIYIDGGPAEASNPSAAIVPNNGAFMIGGLDFSGTLGGFFTGLIDEVQIYDHALTDADVDFLFHNPAEAVEDCAIQKARIDEQIQRLTVDFQQVFGKPEFRIPGETTADQIETLVNAILNLNLGEKQGLFINLNGRRPPE